MLWLRAVKSGQVGPEHLTRSRIHGRGGLPLSVSLLRLPLFTAFIRLVKETSPKECEYLFGDDAVSLGFQSFFIVVSKNFQIISLVGRSLLCQE